MKQETLLKLKKLLTVTVLIVMAAVLFTVNRRGLISPAGEIDSDYFTDFALTDLSGTPFPAETLRAYTLTVVNVWNPYCTACLREMPLLDRLAGEYAAKGVLFLGIEGDAYLYPDEVEKARTLYAETGAGFTQLLADADFTAGVLPLLENAYPGTFLLDRQGRILEFRAGSMEEEDWRAWLDRYL